jgi:hypothetical protein
VVWTSPLQLLLTAASMVSCINAVVGRGDRRPGGPLAADASGPVAAVTGTVVARLLQPAAWTIRSGGSVACTPSRLARLLEGQALTILADVSLGQGDAGQAGDHARQALALHRKTGHRLGEARTLLGLAQRHTGDAGAALPVLQQALGLFTGIGASEAQQARDLLRTPPAEPGR